MNQEKFRFDYENYVNLAFHRRGAILNETVMLERIIDDIIAHYFCDDTKKKQELLELIICTNRMNFENKVQVLKVLLEKHRSSFLETNKTIINDILKKIIVERNVFAHYWLMTGEELMEYIKENKTVFIKFQNTTDYIEYDEDKFIKLMELIGKTINAFLNLQKEWN